jgi:hypothetical protein
MHRGGTLQEPKIRLYSNPEVSFVEIISTGGRPFRFGGAVFFGHGCAFRNVPLRFTIETLR